MEPWLVAGVHLTLAVSDGDKARFEARGRDPVVVVPNSIDTERYAPEEPAGRDAWEILFTGTDAERNLEALRWFSTAVWPRIRQEVPVARFTVAGSFSRSARRPFRQIAGMSFTGPVPDIRPFLHRAALFVAPFRLGGGTRLKVLEAGAAGLAVVATEEGVRGLALDAASDYRRADTAAGFARSVVELLRQREEREALGRNLAKTIRRRFDGREVGRELARVLEEMVFGRRATSRTVPAGEAG